MDIWSINVRALHYITLHCIASSSHLIRTIIFILSLSGDSHLVKQTDPGSLNRNMMSPKLLAEKICLVIEAILNLFSN